MFSLAICPMAMMPIAIASPIKVRVPRIDHPLAISGDTAPAIRVRRVWIRAIVVIVCPPTPLIVVSITVAIVIADPVMIIVIMMVVIVRRRSHWESHAQANYQRKNPRQDFLSFRHDVYLLTSFSAQSMSCFDFAYAVQSQIGRRIKRAERYKTRGALPRVKRGAIV
jgi:hypothetical protein